MTSQEALKRHEKSQYLKVWQVDDTWFYVESEDGKIAYKSCIADQGDFCSCGDFAQRSKSDPSFKCKHLLAVMNSIPRNEVLAAEILEKRRPKLDERFIKQIDNKDFAIYAGLLDLAHQKNLCTVDVDIIQFPMEENKYTAICKAKVETIDGKRFSDIGDANPQNCNSKVAKHLIRMASTRAKARAFRDMDNIGMTALEELGDLNDIIGDDSAKASQRGKENVRKFSKQIKSVFNSGNGESRTAENAPRHVVAEAVSVPAEKQVSVIESNGEARDESETRPVQIKSPVKSNKATGNGNGNGKSDKRPMMSEAQKSALYNLSRRRGISLEDIESRSMEKYGIPVEELTSENAGEFIRYLQAAS
jgi:hypothetical protein